MIVLDDLIAENELMKHLIQELKTAVRSEKTFTIDVKGDYFKVIYSNEAGGAINGEI